MIDLQTLLRVPQVDSENGFDISPDGKTLAFSWNPTGRWEIYTVPTDASSSPRLVSTGPGAKFAPRFSPDGRRLAFCVDFDGSERFHLCVHDLASGRQTDLTPNIESTLQPDFDWSPDGSQIAVLCDRSDCFSTYVMPAAGTALSSAKGDILSSSKGDVLSSPKGGAPSLSKGDEMRLVLENGFPALRVRWSPNGRWLAVCAETRAQDFGVFIVPAEAGEAVQISENGAPLDAGHPRWSPDGTMLAFHSAAGQFNRIGIYQVASGRIEWLTPEEVNHTAPDWSPDGKRLALVRARGAETWLGVQKRGEEARLFQVEPGLHYAPRFAPDGRHLLFVFDSPRRPPDLWSLDTETGKLQQLTQSLPPELQSSSFIVPEEIHYPGLDGQPVPALLYLPPVERPAPAVVVIHGGPAWLYQFMWYPLMTHMAGRGWIVLAPNYRGSTGYGRAWQLANRFDQGGVDTRDVAAGAMYLIRAGLADLARLAVTGRSHGGYLTMTCLTQFPDLWAAASAVVPFLNWFTSHANSREDLQHWDIENMGDPQENHDLWYERSPFFFLDRIRAPVQLICGANDPRCPASESIAARDRLLALGREVDFALYPDEGHAFLKIENVVDAEARRVEFLARVLEGR